MMRESKSDELHPHDDGLRERYLAAPPRRKPRPFEAALDIQVAFAALIAAAEAAFAVGIAAKFLADQSTAGSRRKRRLRTGELSFVELSLLLGIVALVSIIQETNGIQFGTTLAGKIRSIFALAGKPIQILQAWAFGFLPSTLSSCSCGTARVRVIAPLIMTDAATATVQPASIFGIRPPPPPPSG